MKNMARDIFDELSDSDPFENLKTTEEESVDSIASELMGKLENLVAKEHKRDSKIIAAELKDFVRAEIAKIKPTQNVIEKTIEKQVIQPVPFHVEPKVIEAPPQIVKEVRVEVQKENTDKQIIQTVSDLVKQIEDLKKEVAEAKRLADTPIIVPGGPGVIGIPAPEPNPAGYVLTVDTDHKAKWKAATGGSGGLASGTFTVTNPTQNFSLDVTGATIDQLYQVVGTLIQKLQGDI